MSEGKQRLTVTVDPSLVASGKDAVAEGRATSLSAWVNQALADRAERDRHLRSLAEAVAAYEADHGVMTDEELAAQERADREAALVVRRPSARDGTTAGVAGQHREST